MAECNSQRMLSETLTVWGDEGRIVKFQKIKDNGDNRRFVSFSNSYWKAFVQNCDQIRQSLNDGVLDVLHVPSTDKFRDRGLNYRFVTGEYEHGSLFVGFHFDNDKCERQQGGINFTPEEFSVLYSIRNLINSDLERFQERIVRSAKRPALTLGVLQTKTDKLLDVARLDFIKYEKYRFRNVRGMLSEWCFGVENLREKYLAEFPNGPLLDMSKIQHVPDTIVSFTTLGKYVYVTLVMNKLWERVKTLCEGCNSLRVETMSDLDHSSGCEAPVESILEDFLDKARELVTIDRVAQVMLKMSEYLGYSFTRYDMYLFCFVLLSCSDFDFSSRFEVPELLRSTIQKADSCIEEDE